MLRVVTSLTILVGICLTALSLTAQQSDKKQSDPSMPTSTLSADRLKNLAATPSLESAILAAIAEKLEKDKSNPQEVELSLTLRRLSPSSLPQECYRLCVRFKDHIPDNPLPDPEQRCQVWRFYCSEVR